MVLTASHALSRSSVRPGPLEPSAMLARRDGAAIGVPIVPRRPALILARIRQAKRRPVRSKPLEFRQKYTRARPKAWAGRSL